MRGDQSFLPTDLAPPRLSKARIIERQRFDVRRDLAWDLTCVCVAAPPGFGKTTLLAQWHDYARRANRAAAWLTCQETDQDVIYFTRRLIASLVRATSTTKETLSRSADAAFGLDVVAAAGVILAAIDEVRGPLMMFLDDFHHAESTETTALMSRIVNNTKSDVHFVIGSRTIPAINITRLRASGEVLDLRSTDLCFDEAESHELVRRQTGSGFPKNAIDAILARTEGWPIGVRLAAIALAEKPNMPVRKLLSGREPGLYHYLRDEVVSHLPPDLANFVNQTAVLREFSAALADHVRGTDDSYQLISRIEEQQFFILPLQEPGWYRYHPLFADAFVEEGLSRTEEQVRAINLKAAEWLETRGLIDRALLHANASGDTEALARLLARQSENLAHTGRSFSLLRYAHNIPVELLRDHPDLQLDCVYAATLTWQFNEASRILSDVRATLQNNARMQRWTEGGFDYPRIERKLIHREAQLALLKDQMARAADLAKQWDQMEGGCTSFESAVNWTTLIYAQRELFDFSNLDSAPAAREIFEADGNEWATIWHDCIIGASHMQAGDMNRAQDILNRGFCTAQTLYGPATPNTAMPALYLAELKYEQDRTDEASALVDEFLPLATRTGLVDQLIAGFLTQARLAAQSDLDRAFRIFEHGEEIAGSRQFKRLRYFLLAERLRLIVAAGDYAGARRIASLHGLPRDLEQLSPHAGMNSSHTAVAMAAAQVALIDNAPREVERLLSRWVQFLTMRHCHKLAIKMSMMLAQAQLLDGKENPAHRSLRAALQLGCGGFVRSFLDVIPIVSQALSSMQVEGESDIARQLASVRRHAAPGTPKVAMKTPPRDAEAEGPCEALNNREAEILLLISTGMMNKQIAAELGLTLGTVKWYLHQIYGKLGVSRRSEAVFRARRFGLIA